MKFYSESKENVLKELGVNRDRGLSTEDVKSRREKYGLNEFTPIEEGSFWDDLKDALSEPMIVILIIAAIISAVIGEFHDAGNVTAHRLDFLLLASKLRINKHRHLRHIESTCG